MHILCTICSDLVDPAESIYVTKCGHIFHHHCLVQWIERSKSCPQCRNKVTEKCMFRLYPTVSNDATGGEDTATLQSRLDDIQLRLHQEKTISKEKDEKVTELQFELKKYEEIVRAHEKKLVSCASAVKALKEQVEYLKIQNRETVNLKAENESLKQHLQLLNGLNDVLNATCEDVEKMLEGYSDVRTVAIFATALKRGLCESETKKREARDKLHEAKQQISADKNALADLRDKLIQSELKVYEMETKCQALMKRKSGGDMEEGGSASLDAWHPNPKHRRPMDASFIDDTIASTDTEDSISPMVKRVLDADSPYLSLKQSNLALSALQRAPKHSIPVDKIKPSELAMINSARNAVTKRAGTDSFLLNSHRSQVSIFNKKEPVRLDHEDERKTSQPNVCYDGLGGHSKLEIFPVPNNTPVKSYIPKVSAKHKLRRQLPSQSVNGSQDIGKMLQRLMDK